MTTVGAFEAKTHLSSLLDRVERGEEVTITRHGKPVAKLVAVEQASLEEPGEWLRRVRERRNAIAQRLKDEGQPPITTDEILGWIAEGRR